MEAPWEKYPNIWPSSKEWSNGPSSEYLKEWVAFYKELEPEKQRDYRKENKAPFYWFEIYLIHSEELISWTMPTLFLVLLSTPLRYIHFKSRK